MFYLIWKTGFGASTESRLRMTIAMSPTKASTQRASPSTLLAKSETVSEADTKASGFSLSDVTPSEANSETTFQKTTYPPLASSTKYYEPSTMSDTHSTTYSAGTAQQEMNKPSTLSATSSTTFSELTTATEHRELSTIRSESKLVTPIFPQPTESSLPLVKSQLPSITKSSKVRQRPKRIFSQPRLTNTDPITRTVNSIASTIVQQIYVLRYFFG
ncbi:hypothetical protein JTE90_029168 [Oedothorax gibbosus]|uniref:Uncharacterized protein n=1 Tax=Oedothorax gibbosus TaxID=931172 RepID=A0AAV6VDW1_9ARAC|nr:hypothetical protein JTE90_029168 [Oedothorax gibbosus]